MKTIVFTSSGRKVLKSGLTFFGVKTLRLSDFLTVHQGV